jgi:hypothetical protein
LKGEPEVSFDDPKSMKDSAGHDRPPLDPEAAVLTDPRTVLSLLEADQVVAAKRRTHFGRKDLSTGTRFLLWGLRIYVVVMLAIVALSVFRAIQSAH